MLTPTNSVAIHEFSHAGACMQIQESMKGEYSTGGRAAEDFEIFMPQESFWCNLRLDARLGTIKWP